MLSGERLKYFVAALIPGDSFRRGGLSGYPELHLAWTNNTSTTKYMANMLVIIVLYPSFAVFY
tara:strand:- start:489 stop:677 length:189 start_codon:yes stop_codon:yes gene_type:complete